MGPVDKETFNILMIAIAENFGSVLSADGIALRYEALKPYDVSDVKRACMSIVASRKYTSMPTVADFMEHLGGGSAADIAEIEAGKVWEAVGRVGGWRSVVFDSPITQAVIQHGFGGWPRLCEELTEDKRKWFVKEFTQMFGAYARQGIKHTGQLSGRGSGEPALIGDVEKCNQIFLAGPPPDRLQVNTVSSIVKGLLN